ncbi:MAG: metallopeptidase family protein [Nitriliruptoraceae bacterium]|nr:metallopeptidase family protein [Nitriliruptoraceae bacterium]
MERHARRRRTPTDRRRRPEAGFRPGARRFGQLVELAAAGSPAPIREALGSIRVEVRDLPPDDEAPTPLASTSTDVAGQEAAIVLFRRPLEARAVDRQDLVELIREVLIEEVSALGGWDPDDLPPEGR